MTEVAALRRIVVAGAGIAGLTASETLRAEGFDGEIVLVGAEPHAAYSRPALSKALLRLEDSSALGGHELPPAEHDAIELRGVSATGLDPDARTVTLSDGSTLGYDGLVIATGSRARRLTDSPQERTLRELQDAVALRTALADRPRVAVVGGGVLGGEIASGAVEAGCRVSLVATAPPMSKQLGPHLAGLVGAAASARGVEVVVAGDVQVAGDDDVIGVTADGRMLPADVVVTAVGDLANIDWLEGSGLLRGSAPHRVLPADDRGLVRPGIVAAGDVATWHTADGPRRLPLWTSAIEQAKVAARALLRGDSVDPLSFQPYFWTEQFGLHVKAIGPLPLAGDPEIIEQDPTADAALLRWARPGGASTAVSVNWRIPIPKLRRLAAA